MSTFMVRQPPSKIAQNVTSNQKRKCNILATFPKCCILFCRMAHIFSNWFVEASRKRHFNRSNTKLGTLKL